jgi:VWFA-related protein
LKTVMKTFYTRQLLLICAASLLLQICGVTLRAQQQQQNQGTSQPEQQAQADDVLRISTNLVQTDVTVLDKQGKFVEGLKKEDFELKVDGKPMEVGFFERVAAGTSNEEALLAAARGASRAKVNDSTKVSVVTKPLDRGRVVAFFVDDVHMAPDSLKRVKDTIVRFIDKEMGQNDLVAITSASGQIGFLQQYTDNKDVLKRAIARLTYKDFNQRDVEVPVMTQTQAFQINRGDRGVFNYFVDETVKLTNVSPIIAQGIVGRRVEALMQQMAHYSKITLSSLESLARRSASLPGRKLIFFLSDGFPLDTTSSDLTERIRSIADASIRSGVVIYSMDARGLVTGMMDATVEIPFDPSGRMARAMTEETSIGQDVLNALAADTGGRFIHNTNALDPGVTRALKETSVYYLLAWRPVEENSGKKFRRIEVSVKNHPELAVRVQRGYFDTTPEAKQKESANAKATAQPADPLRKAITAMFPKRELPTQLALSYMDTPITGSTLVASMKIDGSALKLEQKENKTAAVVDIAGIIYDDQGKALDNFRQRLTVTPAASATVGAKLPDIIYNYRATLKPGLYQVRVAARDQSSGQTGSAAQWVEVPDLSKQRLSMSSLIVGERKSGAEALEAEKKQEATVEGVTVSVDHRFERTSNLRFLVYIYNAMRTTAASAQPDVALQVQIFRDDQPVVTMPLRKLSTEAQDLTRLAYAAEIPLQEMSAGQYVLQVTAIDRIAKTSTSQKVRFEVQ